MNISDFDYELPERLIAQSPLEDRSASRLLVLHKRTGEIEHRKFIDIVGLLDAGDLLVMNDTRVTAVRLFGHRPSGARVEALVLARNGPESVIALVRPSKKLKLGEQVVFDQGPVATVTEDLGGGRKALSLTIPEVDELIFSGAVPLPPYIHTALNDPGRYQTVYASSPGSAAAPTSGLHFTQEVLDSVRNKGVKTATVTLDVGLDTFRPVAVEKIEDHVMHGERCSVSAETAKAVAECKGRVIAVGTTTVRTLESFSVGKRQLEHGEKTTSIFITPGYEFKSVDGMLTNFHMPRTTMLMMVAALCGKDSLMRAYGEALVENYRFLSFGDAMLIL